MPHIEREQVETNGRPDLAKINPLLAEQRLKAWAYEAKCHEMRRGGDGLPNEMFLGAALVRTVDGHYFSASNIHLHRNESARQCAEANAINQATQELGVEETEIAEIWFTGGIGNLAKNEPIIDREDRARHCPCGSCCQMLYDLRPKSGAEMPVHILPLNDGSLPLEKDPGSAQTNYHSRAVKTRNLSYLFPQALLWLKDQSQSIRAGYTWLDTAEMPEVIPEVGAKMTDLTVMENAAGRNSDAMMQQVNRHILDAVKTELNLPYTAKPEFIRIAIVRSDAGEYYMARRVRDGSNPATPNAVHVAMSLMPRNQAATDLYVMDINVKNRDRLLADPQRPSPAILLEGQEREVLKKFSKGRAVNGPQVHRFILNDPEQFQRARDVIDSDLQALMPEKYANPKSHGLEGASHLQRFG